MPTYDGHKYAIGANGEILTGWLDNKGKASTAAAGTYYASTAADTFGQLVTGLTEISGAKYFFDATNKIVRATNTAGEYELLSGYYINAAGEVAFEKPVTVSGKQYLVDENGELITYAKTTDGKIKVGGINYIIDKDTNEARPDHTEHVWVFDGLTWSSDLKSATGTFTCSEGSEVEAATVVMSEKTNGEGEKAVTRYTATVSVDPDGKTLAKPITEDKYVKADGTEGTKSDFDRAGTGEVTAPTWNLFYTGTEDLKTRTFEVSNTDVSVDEAQVNEYFKAGISGGTITVTYTGSADASTLKKAIGTKFTTFSFDGGEDGRVEFTLPVEFVQPSLKLTSNSATVLAGKKTDVSTTVTYKTASGAFEPLALDTDAVKFGSYTVETGDDGLVTIKEVAGKVTGTKLSIKNESWAVPVELAYSVKESKKHVVTTDLAKNTLVLNPNAKVSDEPVAYTINFGINGDSVTDALTDTDGLKFTVDSSKCPAGLFTYEEGADTATVKYVAGAKGTYSVKLTATTGDKKTEGTATLKIKVSTAGLNKAATLKIQRKYNPVTKETMILVPTLKEISGSIEDVELSGITGAKEDAFEAELNDAGNIVVNYVGDPITKDGLKTKYNMTVNLTLDNGVVVPVELKNIMFNKTTPTVKVPKITATGAEATANILSTYKDSAKNTQYLLPQTKEDGTYDITFENGKKGATVDAETLTVAEDGTISVTIKGITANDSIKATLNYPCGITKKVTISIKKK